MLPLITLAQAATSEVSNAASKSFDPTEAAIRNLLFPFVILVFGIIWKELSDVRKEHISNVRIIDAMLHEIETFKESWQPNKIAFEKAYEGGDNSVFAQKLDENEKYYPYTVVGKTSVSAFSSEDSPAMTFKFISADIMKNLVKFHDKASLLNDSLADLREKAFQELPKRMKLAALGKIVDQFQSAEDNYDGCKKALEEQREILTTKSLTWFIFFPLKSKAYFAHLIIGWIIINMLLRWAKIIP